MHQSNHDSQITDHEFLTAAQSGLGVRYQAEALGQQGLQHRRNLRLRAAGWRNRVHVHSDVAKPRGLSNLDGHIERERLPCLCSRSHGQRQNPRGDNHESQITNHKCPYGSCSAMAP